mgnify:CR=1 FL=1
MQQEGWGVYVIFEVILMHMIDSLTIWSRTIAHFLFPYFRNALQINSHLDWCNLTGEKGGRVYPIFKVIIFIA